MKKSFLITSIIVVAIIIGISSTVLVQSNNNTNETSMMNVETLKIFRKVLVTTTTNVITDLVENIGGDHVLVSGLMGPGVDPHLYRPSANDVKKLQDANIVFTMDWIWKVRWEISLSK